MFVSPAQTWSEINLILYESQGHLYFVCVKSLQYKGAELKYGYAEPYAKKYSLPLLKRGTFEWYFSFVISLLMNDVLYWLGYILSLKDYNTI